MAKEHHEHCWEHQVGNSSIWKCQCGKTRKWTREESQAYMLGSRAGQLLVTRYVQQEFGHLDGASRFGTSDECENCQQIAVLLKAAGK